MLQDCIVPGRCFSGFFQIGPKKAERYFRERTCSSSEDPEFLAHAGYIFLMRITSVNRNNGMFSAESEDYFGSSDISGQVKGNNINFRKDYSREDTRRELRSFQVADFIGSGVVIGDALVAGGTYHPVLKKWKRYEGIWQLDKSSDAKLASPGWMEPKGYQMKPLRLRVD